MVAGEEFVIATACGRDHKMLAAIAMKKLLCCDRGKTWGAVAVDLPDLTEAVGRFLESIGWCGPAEAEFIRDATRERFILIELNPRFPGWIGFGVELGVNLPRKALLATMGRPTTPDQARRDVLFLRACEEVSVDTRVLGTLATKGVMHYG